MPAIQFDLLGEPPTAEEIQVAKERLTLSIKAERMRRRKLLIGWLGVLLASAGGGAHFQGWWALGVVVAVPTIVFLMVVAWNDESEDERALRTLEPVCASHLQDILRACEFDARVEVYRQKVAQQRRDMVIAEAEACQYWHQQGYADSRNWAAVRSPEPLEFEDSEQPATVSPRLERRAGATAE